jgi:hypothetical protein
MRIALCVSVPNGGEQFFNLLINSAVRLSSGKHVLEAEITCHSEAQKLSTQSRDPRLPIRRAHIVPRAEKKAWYVNSITHSRCVNTLFASADADIAVICDYDMALLYKNWDELLVDRIIEQGVAFLGTPYPPDFGREFKLAKDIKIFGQKYQGRPNCMFLAYAPSRIKAMTDRLCDLAATHDEFDAQPLRLVSTSIESRYAGLPIGSFWQLDTGIRVPQLIEDRQLRHAVFERRVKAYTVMRSARFPDDYKANLYPEEYFQNGIPFLAHFRKAASKPAAARSFYDFEQFSMDVNGWIDRMLTVGSPQAANC